MQQANRRTVKAGQELIMQHAVRWTGKAGDVACIRTIEMAEQEIDLEQANRRTVKTGQEM